MKVFISKFALSKGITEIELNDKNSICKDGLLWCMGCSRIISYDKDEWHKTRKEAIEKAEQMRISRMESLKKQVEKLEKLKFQ